MKQRSGSNDERIRNAVERAAREHPLGKRVSRAEIERIAFHVSLSMGGRSDAIAVADLGGGLGLFSVSCALLGMKVLLVDDFRDPINDSLGAGILDYHRSLGIEVIERDVIRDGLGLPEGSLDVVTSFDSMEHWHNSPKKLFAEARRALRPDGRIVLGVPNCVNLRKRFEAVLGRTSWSSMEDWYDAPLFRGHVREPRIQDLRYISHDLGLADVECLGRNWLGHSSERTWVRIATTFADHLLRPFPSLCSDIYLVGRVAN